MQSLITPMTVMVTLLLSLASAPASAVEEAVDLSSPSARLDNAKERIEQLLRSIECSESALVREIDDVIAERERVLELSIALATDRETALSHIEARLGAVAADLAAEDAEEAALTAVLPFVEWFEQVDEQKRELGEYGGTLDETMEILLSELVLHRATACVDLPNLPTVPAEGTWRSRQRRELSDDDREQARALLEVLGLVTEPPEED